MRPETLLSYVRNQPFKPFQIIMNSGRTFEARHPEMIRVGRDYFVFFHASPPDAPSERFETLSLLLTEEVRHLEQPTQPAN